MRSVQVFIPSVLTVSDMFEVGVHSWFIIKYVPYAHRSDSTHMNICMYVLQMCVCVCELLRKRTKYKRTRHANTKMLL